jgi:tetratricopeptide (TPR) repeat protein
MKRISRYARTLVFIWLLLAAVVISTSLATKPVSALQAQAADDAKELEEADRLRSSVRKLYNEGKYDEAARTAKRIVEIREKITPNDFKTADAFNDLGELYLILHRNDQASGAFEKSLKICELNPTQNSLPISHILERLGKLAFLESDDVKAERLLERSLEIRRKALNGDPLRLADSLIDLGNLYYDMHRFTKGERFYIEGLSMLEKVSGASDPKVVNAMKGYGCAVLRAGEGSPKIQPDDVTKSFRKRAACWLYGFDDDCTENPTQRGQYENLVNGKAVKLPIPTYPRGIIDRTLGGTVFVAVRIDEEGRVIGAKSVCGGFSVQLVEASLNAAKEARFTPTFLAGRAIQVNGAIVYRFVPGSR